jgi:GTP cyclohydrolase II
MRREAIQLPDMQAANDHALVRVERAVAELRFGRPVVLRNGQAAIAVLALDGTAPAQFEQFRAAASGRQALYLTGFRAKSLGLGDQPAGIVLPLSPGDFASASRLAYALDAPAPLLWRPASSTLSIACELVRTALLLPAFAYFEMDGTETALGDCPVLQVEDIADGRATVSSRFHCIARSFVPLDGLGKCEFLVFRGGMAQRDQVAIIIGNPTFSKMVPVRIHSSCITGDLLGSLKCDCGDQLKSAMAKIAALGGGVMLYLDHEGRGTGLAAKLRAYDYQQRGLDTIDADAQLGFGPDERDYIAAIDILKQLGIGSINLLTNNPGKADYLIRHGFAVEKCTSVIGPVKAENSNYLRTKAARAGHKFPADYLGMAANTTTVEEAIYSLPRKWDVT